MALPNPVQYHIYTGQDLPRQWPYAYILARQGVFKVVSGPYFQAEVLTALAWRPIAGLAEYPTGLVLHVPRIPVGWLYTVLNHARQAAGQRGGIAVLAEQMYHFYWLAEAGWRVAVPAQRASAGQVRYAGGDDGRIVLDLHSHHAMAACFSGTDDRDEGGCRFYAVIGRIYSRPEIALRLGLYGDFMPLPVTVLFEGPGPFIDTYDEDE